MNSSSNNNSGWTLVRSRAEVRHEKRRQMGGWMGSRETQAYPIYRNDEDDNGKEFYIQGQDWRPVILRRDVENSHVVQQSAKEGPNRRATAKSGLDAQQARKLENLETAQKAKELSAESRQDMQNLRTALGWTQDKLNQQCWFSKNTIREIEAGRLCPTGPQLTLLNRVLKTNLKYATS